MKNIIFTGILLVGLMCLSISANAGTCRLSRPIIVTENGMLKIGTSIRELQYEVFTSKEDAKAFAEAHGVTSNIVTNISDGTFSVFNYLPDEVFVCVNITE